MKSYWENLNLSSLKYIHKILQKWYAPMGMGGLYILTECRRKLSETGCLEEYHDASNPRRVRLVCDQGEMLRIKKAFLATFNETLQTAHRWCDNPNYEANHCKQYESELTDDFIRMCNTISVCSVNQYYTALADCPSTGFDPQMVRRTYIHVEFDCLPSKLHTLLSTLWNVHSLVI